MQRQLIQKFLLNQSLEGKEIVERLCLRIQQLYVQYHLDKSKVKSVFLCENPSLDDDIFELLFNVATLYVH